MMKTLKQKPIRSLFWFCLALPMAAVAPGPLHATGGYDEEPLTSLPDFLKLDQLPAKTLGDIYVEMGKPAPKVEKVNAPGEIATFKEMTGVQVLARIDQLILQARATQDIATLNLLNDLRDLYAGPANAAETTEYVAWRTGKPELDVNEIDARLKKASPALRPHYLYLRGAAVFRDPQGEDRDVKSQVWFDRILKEFPKHPRAEVALFMSARCQISQSRTQDYTAYQPVTNPAKRARAKALLEEYLTKYPKGRWAGDVLGWLGAWHYDGKDYSEALRIYLSQIDYPGHPELTASALEMCEKTLSHMASAPHEKAWATVARTPIAAQALVYLLVNSSESDNYNGKYDPVDEVKAWRKKLLPQVAAAIASQQQLYKDATWRPRYLSTLALAASGAGRQEEALKLLDTAGPEAQTDDLLLARGAVLQRAKRNPEAIASYRALLEKFPGSPLARGVRLRLGLALADDHQAGQAVLELDPLIAAPAAPGAAAEPDNKDEPPEESGAIPIYSEVADNTVRQLIDQWLNFAPIEELAAPAAAPGLDPLKRLRLTEPIAARLLAKEQFEEARKFMTPAQFELFAGPIAKLTTAAREAKEPAARAAACLALGDAWAAARGKLLTYPLDTDKYRGEVYSARSANANKVRIEAASVFGYGGAIRLDLENRDELRHAFNWWIEASDAQPGAAATATALWRALRAMPLIADVSSFTYDRAVTRKWTEVSRKLYDRLRTECADSVEAKRFAVAWNFPAPPKPEPNEFQDFAIRNAAGSWFSVPEAFGMEQSASVGDPDDPAAKQQIENFVRDARTAKPEALKARLQAWRESAKDRITSLYDARWVNFFDDLASFLAEPGIDGETRQRYVEMRARFLQRSAVGSGYGDEENSDQAKHPDTLLQKDIAAALADPKTKPVADYFEFLNLAVIANHFVFVRDDAAPKGKEAEVLDQKDEHTYRTHNYPLLAKKTRAFLDKYPQSKKREAATLLEARAIFRSSEEVPLQHFVTWPQGARWEGGNLTTVTSQEPFDTKRVAAALDAYDRAFPKGRYTADILEYRAVVAIRQHEWKPALEMTTALIADSRRQDLQIPAALHLGTIFDQLADERYRADLLPVIKANPRARTLLLKYLVSDFDAHPLRYLDAWLREQLGAASATAHPKP